MYYTAMRFMKVVWDSKSIPQRRAFLLFGDEVFVKEECLRMLSKKFNVQFKTVDLKGKNDQELIYLVLNPGFFTTEQAFIFRLKKDTDMDDYKKFLETLEGCSKGNVYCVFVIDNLADSARKTKETSKLFDLVKEHGVAINCKEMRDFGDEVESAVASLFQVNDLAIDRDSCRMLLDLVGSSMSRIANAAKVLKLYGKGVTPETIEQVVVPLREDQFFELFSLLAFRRVSKALIILRELMAKSDVSIPLLDSLLSFYMRLGFFIRTPENAREEYQVEGALGIKSYMYKKLNFLIKFYDFDRVSESYRKIHEAYRLCFGDRNNFLITSRLVVELCQQQ